MPKHIRLCYTGYHKISSFTRKLQASSLMAARTATFGSRVAQTCARSVMVHLLVLWAKHPCLVPATKQLFRSLTSDLLEACFLPLIFLQGFALVRNDLPVDNYSIPTRLYLPTYKIKGYSGKLDLAHPHMMVDAFGNGDDCRKSMSSPKSGNIDYGVGPSPTTGIISCALHPVCVNFN